MFNLVSSADSEATSTSRIRLSAEAKFSLATSKLLIDTSSLDWVAPKTPLVAASDTIAELTASRALLEADCAASAVDALIE